MAGKPIKAVIDRIESGIAVLEFDDGFTLEIPAKYIAGAREGLVVEIRGDRADTAARVDEIKKLQRELEQGKHLKKDKQ